MVMYTVTINTYEFTIGPCTFHILYNDIQFSILQLLDSRFTSQFYITYELKLSVQSLGSMSIIYGP